MNCWILCLPRTGSSYLCELLNNTNVFPIFEDPRLKDNIGPIQKDRAFNEWLRIFSSYHDLCQNPPACCKAIYHQYIEVMGEIPSQKRRKPDASYLPLNKNKESFVIDKFKLNAIQSLFTNIKFIHLKRNILEQTVSTYFARKTLKYHIYDENHLKKYLNESIEINYKIILEIYDELISLEKSWENLFCRNNKILDVDYEDLTNHPAETLEKILKFLGIDTSTIEESITITKNAKRIHKMTRPESKQLMQELSKKLKLSSCKLY